jgi:hypothetical protein
LKEGSWYLTVDSAATAAKFAVSKRRPLMQPLKDRYGEPEREGVNGSR